MLVKAMKEEYKKKVGLGSEPSMVSIANDNNFSKLILYSYVLSLLYLAVPLISSLFYL
jgi:hypothetical protein